MTNKIKDYTAGADPGGAQPVHTPPKIGKNMIFWCKIVIFHMKYPKNFQAKFFFFFFRCAPPNLKSWICPCIYRCRFTLILGYDLMLIIEDPAVTEMLNSNKITLSLL